MTATRCLNSFLMIGALTALVFVGACNSGNEDSDNGNAEARSSKSTGSESTSSSPSTQESPEQKSESKTALTETEMEIPDAPVSGTIAGQRFEPDTIEFDQQLTFGQGGEFIPDFSITLFLFLRGDKDVQGKSWTVTGEQRMGTPHLHVRFIEEGSDSSKTEVFMDNYALKLEFGQADSQGQMPGRIFLQLDEEPGASLAGTFTVQIPDDYSKLPADWYRPWVVTPIELPDDQSRSLEVGYVGRTSDGEWESNLAGTRVQPGASTFASSTTHKPRITTLAVSENLGVHGRHVRLSAGKYLFYVTEEDSYLVWKTSEVSADTSEQMEFQIDTSDAGKLLVEATGAQPSQRVELMPLTPEGEPPLELENPFDRHQLCYMIDSAELEGGKARFDSLAPGKYRVFLNDQSKDVEVNPGEESTVAIDLGDEN